MKSNSGAGYIKTKQNPKQRKKTQNKTKLERDGNCKKLSSL